MDESRKMKPLKIWQSLILFLGPGLYGLIAQYWLFPIMVRRGFSEEYAYNLTHLSVFALLLILLTIALRVDGWTLNAQTLRERLRYRKMDARTWKLTGLFLVLYLAMGLLLNTAALFLFEKINFSLPATDFPLTNIPFLLLVFSANIISEEFLWRGYILPRQELQHGRYAWIVNGVLWSFFHLFKWYAIPFQLLKHWMLPYLAQRTENSTPPFLIHLVSNGLGIVMSIIPLL